MSAYVAHPTLRRPCPTGTSTWGDVLAYVTGGYGIDSAHCLRGPGVRVELVEPEASTQPIIHPWSAILHSNAGPRRTPWWNLIAYWRRSDITGEAHFQLSGVDPAGPSELVQGIPLNRRADCNYKANSWWRGAVRVGAISFETEDNGGATLDQTPWSPAQLRHLIGALTAICLVYGVACTVPTDAYDSGIGHHALFKLWSAFVGKTCPGAARIRQMDYIRAQVATNLAAIAEHTGWTCGQGRP